MLINQPRLTAYTVNRYSDIEAFFRTYFDLDNDRDIFDRITNFRMQWAIKRIDRNYTNLDFLSGITMGVQAVRFSPLDESRLADEVFRNNMLAMQEDFYRVEGIYREWKVSSTVIYQALLYMIRYILKNNLPLNYLYESYYIMAYKMITSLLVRRFDYSLDPRVASRVVEEMSEKFLLKELGSWQKYFEYRATFLLPGTKHANRLLNEYSATIANIVVNDIQVNIRSTVNRLYSLIIDVSKSDMAISNDSLTKMENEEVVLSDLKSYSGYADRSLKRVNSDDFADDNAIYIISEISSNINTTIFKTLLVNISKSGLDDFDNIASIVRDSVKFSLQYLMRTDNIGSLDNNIIGVLRALKSYYSSSTVRDPGVVDLKARTMELVKRNTTINTSWLLTAMNINLILYIVLMGLIKNR